jgi:tRNA-Thr(GGU) m(6)t(6)A37 methyltransferase TsaA
MSETISMQPIGWVRNSRESTIDAGWGAIESRIELRPEAAAGLEGLDQFSHVLVIFYMHLDPDREAPVLRRRPRGRDDMPLLGVFAQRGRMRPNPIGVTAVEIVRLEPGVLVVRGLDAVDGTPVLDLKPYAPAFDRREAAPVPEWLDRLMQGYF